MSVDDISILREQLPEVFQDISLPQNWEEDWLIIPVDDPESVASVALSDYENSPVNDAYLDNIGLELSDEKKESDVSRLPDFGENSRFPGAPYRQGSDGGMLPPDAYAFYLPFHHFYPNWWGIYLVLDRVHDLANYLRLHSCYELERNEAFQVARVFLYGHEAFHHIVESFATRLEVTHRSPLYKDGFNSLFKRHYGTDECTEESLANAYAYRKVKSILFKGQPKKRDASLRALKIFIEACPPGYRRGVEFVKEFSFSNERNKLAEANHRESLPAIPTVTSNLWRMSPHAFSGISRITSRVNYIVNRDSHISKRLGLNLRYLRYRDVSEKLRRLGGCVVVRQGSGSHEIWKAPNGTRFPVPRHPGEFHRGLLSKIIKQAGLQMPLSQFLQA